MAAAVAARRLSSSLAASARSTPTGASAPTIRCTTRPFFKRPYSSEHQPDPTKMKEVAENLVKVLKETPSEATSSKAESLVNQLKGFYPPPVETELTLKELVAQVSKIEKSNEIRFIKLELRSKYLIGWAWGTSYVFAAALMAVPAGIYYFKQDVTSLVDQVKGEVEILQESKVPTKVEVEVKLPQSG